MGDDNLLTNDQLIKDNQRLRDNLNKLEVNALNLQKTIIDLENQLAENKKWTATIYAPNKCTYEQLELKVKNLETQKQKDIEELWETRITPLQNHLKDRNIELDTAHKKSQCQDSKIKQLQQIIKNLETRIDFAVGYISATQPHTDKHPMEVKKWLFEGFRMKDEI